MINMLDIGIKLGKLVLRDKILFVLLIVSTAFISFITCFTYAMILNQYIESEVGENKKGNADSLEDYYGIQIDFDEGSVTKGEVVRCLSRIIDSYDDVVENTFSDGFLFTNDIDWGYSIKTPMEIHFTMDKEGKLSALPVLKNAKKYGDVRGSIWTEDDESQGNNVAIFWDYIDSKSPNNKFPPVKTAKNKDNTVTIEGIDYKIIGYRRNDYYPTPWVPLNSLPDHVGISFVGIYFNEYVTENTFRFVEKIFIEELGDRVIFPNESKTRRKIKYTNNTAYIAAGLLALVMLINYVILFTYVFEKIKIDLYVFRLCGISLKNATVSWIGECILLSVPIFILSLVVFHLFIRKWIRPYFRYVGGIFSFKIYLLFTVGYLVLLLLLCILCFAKRIGHLKIIRKEVA
ncbi:MAG: hypothetical protein IKQ71_06500 [Lachnospiraceae bacterium]|nr:hypothetical protein [Lachnospiraceae bacterium]